MLKIDKATVTGWESAIRGMRNPMNSWAQSDSYFNCNGCPGFLGHWPEEYDCNECSGTRIGEKDHALMMRLAKAGPVHAKYRRMVAVYADITAPLYLWKQIDTYKVGTVTNSCSTMHTLHKRDLTLEDFSCEFLTRHSLQILQETIDEINKNRRVYVDYEPTRDFYIDNKPGPCFGQCVERSVRWYNMVQLLPTSFNQLRTVMLNYEVLSAMYRDRKDHKLPEWHTFCEWVETLPYSEIITVSQK